jgi:hypothetical protein
MLHAINNRRRAGLAVGAIALAFGVATTTLAQPASAEPASTAVTNAINAKENASADFRPPNRVRDDVDGDNRPNITPDRQGGFMFYRGNFGRGAIYGHTRSGVTSANKIFGNILAAWELRGWETGAGYPVSDERDPNATERRLCPAATKIQHFRKPSDSLLTTRMACFMPGATATPFDVAWTG